MAKVENQMNTQRTEDQATASSKVGTGAPKENITLPRSSSTSVQHPEPEDAYLTGGQRNLQRRVLGLNVEANQSRPADQSAGLHSTGSFTGTANDETHREKGK
jgi:hypothetical protein